MFSFLQRRSGGTSPRPVAQRSAATMRGLPAREKLFVCIIFAITGSSAAAVVRPALAVCRARPEFQSLFGIDENSGFVAGPAGYRVLYFLLMWPMYTALLVFYGTLFQRRAFFSEFALKMWSRFLPSTAAQGLRRLLKLS